MIARHGEQLDKTDVWAALSAPLPAGTIQWRIDGRPVTRDGKYFARCVAYIDAHTVRERFDRVVPGEWDASLDLLPPAPLASADEVADEPCAFKCRLQVLGVIREDVGTGADYKAAATDAFKRAAVRFGIGTELYRMGSVYVQVDSDKRNAKPLEDPQAAYERRAGRAAPEGEQRRPPSSQTDASAPSSASAPRAAAASRARADGVTSAPAATANATARAAGPGDEQPCPQCGGRTWDNRLSKRNPKAPDFKCRDRSCDGAIWPPKDGDRQPAAIAADGEPEFADDDLPF